MNLDHAKAILDRVRDGVAYPPHTIAKALEMTGDIDGHIKGMDEDHRSAGLDQTLQEESYGGGENRSMVMVAENLVRLGKKTWTTRR